MKKILLVTVVVLLLWQVSPRQILAVTQGTFDTAAQGTLANPPQGTLTNPAPASTMKVAAKLENPLAGVNSISDLFYKIVNFLISFSYVVIAFFLILSGFKFVKAQGSDTELEEAKRMFYGTIIGALVIIGAQTITTVVQKIIEGLSTK